MFIFYHSFQNLKLYTQLTVAWTLFVGFLNVHCLFFVGSFTIISFVSYWTSPDVPPEDGWGHCDEWQSLAKLEGWEGCCNKRHGEGTGCFMGVGTDSFWPSLEDWVKFPTKVNRVKTNFLNQSPRPQHNLLHHDFSESILTVTQACLDSASWVPLPATSSAGPFPPQGFSRLFSLPESSSQRSTGLISLPPSHFGLNAV